MDDRDRSNGWETVALTFIDESRRSTVGVATVQAWADALPPSAAVLDLGCGPGTLRSRVLANREVAVYAVEASPTLANAYQSCFPSARVVCEAVEESPFFDKTFDGVLAWGLMFLLPAESQRELIHRVASVLKPGGQFLFTAPAQACAWDDLSTGRQSLSPGANAYKMILADAGLTLLAEYDDEGENHYYAAFRP